MTETQTIPYDDFWAHVDTLPWFTLATTGRTGTDLLQSLLDSHPELSVYNGAHFFHVFWAGAQTVNYGGPLIAEDIVDEYIGQHINKLHGRYDLAERKGELGENSDEELYVDLQQFRTHVLSLLAGREPNSRNFLIAIHVAFDLCLGHDVMKKKVFMHHAHRVGRTLHFRADFPDCKILCMTRDPRANLVSGVERWRKYQPHTNNPSYPIYVIWRALDEMAELKEVPDNRLAVLRLEDLGDKDVLTALCEWVGVSYHPSLEESTWGGLRWWGDRLSEQRVPEAERGFSPTMISNRWRERLSGYDQFVLNHVTEPMLRRYGYPRGTGSHAAWAPLVALAILLPSTYERPFLAPGFLLRATARGQVRVLLRSFWHPLRRMRLYYGWMIRRYAGSYFGPALIGRDVPAQDGSCPEC